jgi:hypothetical protein
MGCGGSKAAKTEDTTKPAEGAENQGENAEAATAEGGDNAAQGGDA